MIDTKQTNLAVQLAYQAHRGQTDKAGLRIFVIRCTLQSTCQMN